MREKMVFHNFSPKLFPYSPQEQRDILRKPLSPSLARHIIIIN